MPITSTNCFTLTTMQSIIIDCEALSMEQEDTKKDLSKVTQWINEQREKTDVHVILRRATGSAAGRMLRRTLLSLGCTVVMKITA